MKALVGAFNQEKALVGAFSVIVQLHRLIDLRHYCRQWAVCLCITVRGEQENTGWGKFKVLQWPVSSVHPRRYNLLRGRQRAITRAGSGDVRTVTECWPWLHVTAPSTSPGLLGLICLIIIPIISTDHWSAPVRCPPHPQLFNKTTATDHSDQIQAFLLLITDNKI